MDAGMTLAWMRENGQELRNLIEQEVLLEGDETPAGDPSIRAHLRFLALALEHTLAAPWAELSVGFSDDLVPWFREGRELFDQHLAAGEGAMLLETHLQWRTEPGIDPSLDVALERRLRLLGWSRLFLLGLEGHLGPAADGISTEALAWMDGRHRELGRMVISMDAHARSVAGRSGSLSVAALEQLGQAVLVQAYTRHLAEAVHAALAEPEPGDAATA